MIDTHTWALILAAGDGSRLSTITTDDTGVTIPKQFCSLNGGPSLLELAMNRAQAVVPNERICTIVADEHRQWWHTILEPLPKSNIIVQPRNRGTGNGILLPLLKLLAWDPFAQIIVIPSDHYVREELILTTSLRAAANELAPHSNDIILLGIAPEEADPELGYILPALQREIAGPLAIKDFVEKPSIAFATQLIDRGGLWNTFMFAANGPNLLNLFRSHYPLLLRVMRRALDRSRDAYNPSTTLCELYTRLPHVDFSRHVLARAPERLRVRPVPRCGWTDLGTVYRVTKVLRGLPKAGIPARQEAHFDLATSVAEGTGPRHVAS